MKTLFRVLPVLLLLGTSCADRQWFTVAPCTNSKAGEVSGNRFKAVKVTKAMLPDSEEKKRWASQGKDADEHLRKTTEEILQKYLAFEDGLWSEAEVEIEISRTSGMKWDREWLWAPTVVLVPVYALASGPVMGFTLDLHIKYNVSCGEFRRTYIYHAHDEALAHLYGFHGGSCETALLGFTVSMLAKDVSKNYAAYYNQSFPAQSEPMKTELSEESYQNWLDSIDDPCTPQQGWPEDLR